MKFSQHQIRPVAKVWDTVSAITAIHGGKSSRSSPVSLTLKLVSKQKQRYAHMRAVPADTLFQTFATGLLSRHTGSQ